MGGGGKRRRKVSGKGGGFRNQAPGETGLTRALEQMGSVVIINPPCTKGVRNVVPVFK